MTRKLIAVLATILLGVCLLSGGCLSPEDDSRLNAWKELIKIAPDQDKADEEEKEDKPVLPSKPVEVKDHTEIVLYFADSDENKLAIERRNIEKAEGIARETIEELINGPKSSEYTRVFPEGTRLLDINITEDGLCILDFSTEVQDCKNAQEEDLMLESISKTLGQFPTVQRIAFMINGQRTDRLAGFADLSNPIEIAYSSQP
jgi:spore germination protein GerM